MLSINQINLDEWKEQRCFVLGGGSSLEGFDYSILNNELTIGTNKTILFFNPTINYSMDRVFYNYITAPYPQDEEQLKSIYNWNDYEGIKLFLKPADGFVYPDNVYVVNQIKEPCLSLDLNLGIYSGDNSGFGALMLACALGCKEIYLLGIDLQVGKKGREKKTHCHNGYPHTRIKSFESRSNKYKNSFNLFATIIEGIGVKVFNCSPISKLECFEKKELKDIIFKEEEIKL